MRRFGGEVVLVEGEAHVLAREPAPLGEALGEALRSDGNELVLGVHATAARREGKEFILELADGRQVRGDRLLVATGRRPRVDGIGLETVGIAPDARGIPVDPRMHAGERLWAIGDVTGIWQLTQSASTRVRSWPQTSSASPVRPTTRRSRVSPTPTRRRRPSARPTLASAPPRDCLTRQDSDLHARLRRIERLFDPAQ